MSNLKQIARELFAGVIFPLNNINCKNVLPISVRTCVQGAPPSTARTCESWVQIPLRVRIFTIVLFLCCRVSDTALEADRFLPKGILLNAVFTNICSSKFLYFMLNIIHITCSCLSYKFLLPTAQLFLFTPTCFGYPS
jgi:hypothetical protein